MEVVAADVRRPLGQRADVPRPDAIYGDIYCIVYRDRQDDDGHEQVLGAVRRAPVADDADAREREAQERRARVAQVDAGRPEVVVEEPDGRARETERRDRDDGLAGHERDCPERDGRDRRHARREAVETVEEVHRVRDPHDPDDGEQHLARLAERRRRQERHHDAVLHHEAHGRELADEPHAGRQPPLVVGDADRGDENPRGQRRKELALQLGRQRRHGQRRHGRRRRSHERRDHHRPAQQRHRALVALSLVRNVQQADLVRDVHRERRQRQRDAGREREREDHCALGRARVEPGIRDDGEKDRGDDENQAGTRRDRGRAHEDLL